jgi:hypothetical protein
MRGTQRERGGAVVGELRVGLVDDDQHVGGTRCRKRDNASIPNHVPVGLLGFAR